jgi:hypothetical protein
MVLPFSDCGVCKVARQEIGCGVVAGPESGCGVVRARPALAGDFLPEVELLHIHHLHK